MTSQETSSSIVIEMLHCTPNNMDLDQVSWNRYIQLHRFILSQRGALVKTNLVAVYTQYIGYKLPLPFVVSSCGRTVRALALPTEDRGFESHWKQIEGIFFLFRVFSYVIISAQTIDLLCISKIFLYFFSHNACLVPFIFHLQEILFFSESKSVGVTMHLCTGQCIFSPPEFFINSLISSIK